MKDSNREKNEDSKRIMKKKLGETEEKWEWGGNHVRVAQTNAKLWCSKMCRVWL